MFQQVVCILSATWHMLMSVEDEKHVETAFRHVRFLGCSGHLNLKQLASQLHPSVSFGMDNDEFKQCWTRFGWRLHVVSQNLPYMCHAALNIQTTEIEARISGHTPKRMKVAKP